MTTAEKFDKWCDYLLDFGEVLVWTAPGVSFKIKNESYRIH